MKIKSLIFAAAVMLFASAVSCTKETVKDTLTVEPSAALSFEVSDNADVTLTIKTNAQKWEYSVPEWVVATREGETLKVNVEENTDVKARVGRIVVTAGSAEPVRINVHQAGVVEDEEEVVDGVAVTLNNKLQDEETTFNASTVVEGSVSVSIAEAIEEDIVVTIGLDPEYAPEYSFIAGAEFVAASVESVTFASTELTIPAGQTESETVTITIDPASYPFGVGTLVPVLAEVKSGAAKFEMDEKRVNYIVNKINPKEGKVKNFLFFEVNDCNPLNALEYLLDDGKDTPFFDVVVLFAANINYDSANDVVYLHNNPNVQALLNESETYIQPLRKKGIKVQLGLLGNHTPAGLCQLSDWGAKEWAKEVAEACRVYKLDGVNLDDEYSGAPIIGNKWFTSESSAAGSRLAYELKMAMKEACYWPTEVSIFSYSTLGNLPAITQNGVEIDQTEFVDQVVANYGSKAYPFGDEMGKDRCSGFSVELNRGYTNVTEDSARELVNAGYGWAMWFAFDPSGTGSVSSNYSRSLTMFRAASKAFYGCDLKDPQNTYKKIKEGQYDPTPYPIN